MLESPAYRVLSQSEHRCLSRIEVELCHHGGADNGKLPVTFDDFEKYGVHRHSIAPALRGLAALGFIEVTREGRAGNAEWRRPAWFRLTYRHTADLESTDEWRRIGSLEAAEAIAKAARQPLKKQKPSGGNRTKGGCGFRTTNRPIHGAEPTTTCVSAETTTTSISRVGGGRRDRVIATANAETTTTLEPLAANGAGEIRVESYLRQVEHRLESVRGRALSCDEFDELKRACDRCIEIQIDHDGPAHERISSWAVRLANDIYGRLEEYEEARL